MRTGAILSLVAALLCAPAAALAQGLRVNTMSGALELGAEASLQTVESSGAANRDFDRFRFRERISVALGGHLLTEQFVTYRLGGNFGLTQERIRASGPADAGDLDTRPFGYDTLVTVLPTKPVSLRLFGSRNRNSVFQNFGTDTESESEVLGSAMDLRIPWFPTTVSWQELSTLSRTVGGFVENRREEVRERLQVTGNHFSETTTLTLRYRDEDIDDASIPPVGDYGLRQVDGHAGYRWGDYFEKSVQTSFRSFERTGVFEFDNTSVSSNVRWDPTETLVLETRYNFEEFESNGDKTTEHIGAFSLDHELYESLRTNFSVSADVADQTARDRRTYTGDLSFSYRKRLPRDSALNVDLDLRYQLEDSEVEKGVGIVVGESLPITDLSGNFLANPNVDPAAVEVFENLGGALLIEGIDYAVEAIGDRTSINPLLGGAISVGEIVFVNYEFLLDPSAKTETRTVGFGIGWQKGWLHLRYERDQADERLLEGSLPSSLLDGRRDTFRLELRGRRGRLSFTSIARYLQDRLTTLDYDEISFQQSMRWDLRKVEVTFHLLESLRDFPEQGRETNSLTLGAAASWWLRPQWKLRFFADFRDLDDSESVDQRDLKLGIRGDFDLGAVDVTPSVTWTRRERGGSQTTDLRGILRFRRSF